MKLLDPLPLFILGRSEPIEPSRLRAIIAEIDPALAATGARRTRRRFVIIVTFAVIVLGVIAQVAIVLTGDLNAIRTLTNPLLVLPVLISMLVPIFIVRANRQRTLKRVMLRHRCCPHCGYALCGLHPERDGATLCPECASAWQLDDVGSPESPDPAVNPDGTAGAGAGAGAGKSRFGVLLVIGLTIMALLVTAFLVYEFSN